MKKYLIWGGVALAVYLAYRYYQNQNPNQVAVPA